MPTQKLRVVKMLSAEQARQAREWVAEGWTRNRVGAELGCSPKTVSRVLAIGADGKPTNRRRGRLPMLSAEQVREAYRLRALGWSVVRVGAELSCSSATIFAKVGAGRARRGWEPAEGRLSLAEREEISLGLGRRETFSCIGSRLGRAASTVSREVAANGGRLGYRAWRAQSRAFDQARRPKDGQAGRALFWPPRWRPVAAQWWSPERSPGACAKTSLTIR